MTKRKIPKIQHYVPQFILRNFCVGKTAQICVFDKTNGSVFISNIKNVAAEKGFYDLAIKDITATLEFSLSDLEGETSIILNKIIEDGSLINISSRDKKLLSFFFATQILRVPRIRKTYEQMNNLLISIIEKMGFDPKEHPQILQDEEDFRNLSIGGMPEMANELAPYFYNKDWILFNAPTDSSYYISDNPVTLTNQIDYSPYGSLGLAVKGIEIYFPISKSFSLGMICPSYKEMIDDNYGKLDFLKTYYEDQKLDITRDKIEDIIKYKSCTETGLAFQSKMENVIYHNSLQVIRSSRFIFSEDDDFSLAKEMIEAHPEFRRQPQIHIHPRIK